MNNFEKLKTRIIIAKSIGKSPDYIGVKDSNKEDEPTLYFLEEFKGHNLCLAFDRVPTIEEARNSVKDLYLSGVELDFDLEMKTI